MTVIPLVIKNAVVQQQPVAEDLQLRGDLNVDDYKIFATDNLILQPGSAKALQADDEGDTRGQYAVDWQMSRELTSEVVSGTYSVIAGGKNNCVTSSRSAVLCGQGNQVSNNYSSITGGFDNSITSIYSFIGGGYQNEITATYGVIGGGYSHSVSTIASIIAGGYDNTISGGDGYCTISGGRLNENTATYGVIGGGYSNIVSGICGVICGGRGNEVTASYTAIGGGYDNQVTAIYGVICGGRGNQVTANYGVIGGGYGNQVTANYSTVLNGVSSKATAIYSVASGYQAEAINPGEHAQTSIQVGAGTATSQTSVLAMGRQVSSTAASALYLYSGAYDITMSTYHNYLVKVDIIGYRIGGSGVYAASHVGVIQCYGAANAVLRHDTQTIHYRTTVAMTSTLYCSARGLQVRMTNTYGTYNFCARVEITQVGS